MAVHPAAAQETGTVVGTVVAARSGASLSGVNVVVVGTLFATVTDAQGRFTLTMPPDTYTFQISALDYRPARRSVDVRAGDTTRVRFRLRPPVADLDAVAFDAVPGERVPAARVERRRLSETVAASPEILVRVLDGAGAGRFGPLGMMLDVRGLSENQLVQLQDGLALAGGDPLQAASSLRYTDPAFIDRIEGVKGPYALTWGAGALGGVRIRHPQAGTSSERAAQVGYASNVDQWEAAGTWSGAAGRWAYLAQGAYRLGDDYEDGDGRVVQGDHRSGAVRGQVAYAAGPSARLTVGGAYQDQRGVEEHVPPFAEQDVRAMQGAARYRAAWTGGAVRAVDGRVYWHRAQHEARHGGVGIPEGRVIEGEAIEGEGEVLGARAVIRVGTGAAWDVDVGGEVRWTRHRAGATAGTQFEAHATTGGVFALAHHRGASIELTGAVRADVARSVPDRLAPAFVVATGQEQQAPEQTDLLVSASVTATKRLSPTWRVSAGLGTAARAPSLAERYGYRVPARTLPTLVVDGAPSLDPERSVQADLWAEGDYDRVRISVSTFARQMVNDVAPVPVATRPAAPTAILRAQYRNGTATFAGAEAEVTYRLAGRYAQARVGGSYLWGQNTAREEPARAVPPPMLHVGLRATAPADLFFIDGALHLAGEQGRVATSLGESPTPGYVAASLHFGLRLPGRAALLVGLDNLAGSVVAYHLSAFDPARGGRVPEPGFVVFSRLRVQL